MGEIIFLDLVEVIGLISETCLFCFLDLDCKFNTSFLCIIEVNLAEGTFSDLLYKLESYSDLVGS